MASLKGGHDFGSKGDCGVPSADTGLLCQMRPRVDPTACEASARAGDKKESGAWAPVASNSSAAAPGRGQALPGAGGDAGPGRGSPRESTIVGVLVNK